jgi:hypothetical protein
LASSRFSPNGAVRPTAEMFSRAATRTRYEYAAARSESIV